MENEWVVLLEDATYTDRFDTEELALEYVETEKIKKPEFEHLKWEVRQMTDNEMKKYTGGKDEIKI